MKLRKWCSCSIAVGITMFPVGTVFYFLVNALLPEVQLQYDNRALFRLLEGTRAGTYMLAHPFLYGSVFAAVFLALRKGSTFPAGIRGGLIYGAGVFSVGSLPVFVLAFASFQVSAEVIVTWIVQNLCQYLAAGIALGAVADGVTVRLSTQLPASADEA